MSGKSGVFFSLLVFLLLGAACSLVKTKPIVQPTWTPRPTPVYFTDFDTGEPFDCWTETAPEDPGPETNGDLFFTSLVAESSEDAIYRYRSADQTYEKIVSDVALLHIAYEQVIQSPAGDAFWYEAKGSSGETQIFVYRQATGKSQEVPFIGEGVTPQPAQWSAGGNCLIITTPPSLVAYRLSDGKLQKRQVPGIEVRNDLVSPMGKWWAVGNGTGIDLFDLSGARLDSPALIPGFGSGVMSWSPDGKSLAFGYETSHTQAYYYQNVRLLSFQADGSIAYRDIAKYSYIQKITWSPDSRYLYIYASRDGSAIQIYDAIDHVNTAVPDGLKGINLFCLSPDGKYVFATHETGKGSPFYIYDLSSGEKKYPPQLPGYTNDDESFVHALIWLRR